MRHCLLLLLAGLMISLTSCRNDFEFEPSTGNLTFSRDTVYLDTVFTNIGSSTYTLKVYNRSNKDIKIPTIRLGEGDQSKYRLMIDGDGIGSGTVPGRIFHDVELLAKDSMFIFIETTIDYTEYANNETTFLYTDRIEFDSGSNFQKVELVTLVQDAIFLFPARNEEGLYEAVPTSETDERLIYGFNLSHEENGDEFIWTNQKPYVVYGMAVVPTGETLNVQAGARVHFHADSGLIVRNGGVLNVNGAPSAELENEVIFEGDRLEPGFASVPGQWLTVWLQDGSRADIKNLTLKNALIGIRMDGNDGTPDTFKLHNTKIYNSSISGLQSRNGTVQGTNLVINNAGMAAMECRGGSYDFKHCTFANYFNSYNQVPVLITDYFDTEEARYVSDMDAVFSNCILYGSSNYGLLFDRVETLQFNYAFRNCLIKFNDFNNQFQDNPLYSFEGGSYPGSLIAKTSSEFLPEFENPQQNQLNISNESAANGAADFAVSQLVPADVINNPRANPSDIGAYESAEFEE